MRTRTASVPALLLTIVLGATACSSAASSTAPPPAPDGESAADHPLVSSQWVAIELGGARVAPGGDPMTLQFDAADQASGSTGVNSWSGPVTLYGKSVTFGPIATTLRAGTPERMAEESRFLGALRAARRIQVHDGELDLHGEDGATLVRLAFVR